MFLGMVCFMTYSVYSLNFSSLFPQQSQYIMMITLFFLLSIGWTFVSLAWFVACNHYMTKGEMPPALHLFCQRLQRMCFCCFPSTKGNDNKVNNKNDIVENSQLKKDANLVSVKLENNKRAKLYVFTRICSFYKRKDVRRLKVVAVYNLFLVT